MSLLSYYPRGPIIGKGEFTKLQNWMRQVDLDARGIQTGPFAAHSAHFAPIFIIFVVGSHFLLPQSRGPIIGKGEITPPQDWMRQMDFNAWGIQTM